MALFKEETTEILSDHSKKIIQRKYNSTFGDMHRFYRKGTVFLYKFLFSNLSNENLSKIFSKVFSSQINYKYVFEGEEIDFSSNKMTKESVKHGKIAYKSNFDRTKGLTIVVEGRVSVNYTTVQIKKRFFSKNIKVVYREAKINDNSLEKYSPRGRAEFALWKRDFRIRSNHVDDAIEEVLLKV